MSGTGGLGYTALDCRVWKRNRMRRSLALVIAALAVALSRPAAADARLSARPGAAAEDSLPAGVSPIGKSAFAYRPPLPANATPGLLVLFHGAGGDARRFLDLFRAEADRRQLVLLSVQSIDSSWDVVLRGARDTWNVGRASPVPAPGADARRVDAALRQMFRQMRIDPRRIAAAGFSDGASYALSLGLANDRLFTGIAALAPGFAAEGATGPAQRIAIAHGRSDRVLSFANAERIAADLRNRGYPVRFISFDGGHAVSSSSLGRALDFALGSEAPPTL